MKNRSNYLVVILVFIIGFAGTILIMKNNDHIECETVVKKDKNNDGDIVTRTEHVCKEKYSF
jgi:lipopolysaccharide export system protein LptC